MFALRKTIYPIGLNISDSSVKLVQLKKGSKIKIKALGQIFLNSGLVVGGQIINEDKVAEKIKQMCQKPGYGRIISDKAVVGLPESKSFIRLIEVKRSSNRLADVIETEIKKYIPINLDEMYYDWQVINQEEHHYNILIGACEKKYVNQYTRVLDKANLEVEALEIEPIAICRALLKEESDNFQGLAKNYAIIDLGCQQSSLMIYSENSLLFTVSLPITGQKITEGIMNEFKLNKEQADKVKFNCALDASGEDKKVNDFIRECIVDLSKKVKEALSYVNDHFGDRGSVSEVFLIGGGSNIKDIDVSLSEFLMMPVKQGNTLVHLNDEAKVIFKNYKLNENKKKGDITSSDASLFFASAIGLALRSIFIKDI